MNEQDVAEWLLYNQNELKEEINRHSFIPSNLADIYYKEHCLNIIKNHLAHYLNPEQIHLIITEEFIIMILGNKFLCPNSILVKR